MEFYIRALKKYAEFQGVDSRQQFWMFFLIHFLITIAVSIVSRLIGFPLLATLYGLALLIPALAIGARRLRDAGFNPLLLLLLLIPLLGFIILIVLWAQPSKTQA